MTDTGQMTLHNYTFYCNSAQLVGFNEK